MKDLKNLLPETEEVLKNIAGLGIVSDFTFVGGSALSIYLSHRFSEDIDLFTWNKTLDIEQINAALKNAGFGQIKTINLSPTQADFIVDGVKLTFFANGWEELKQRRHLTGSLFIATLETIAVMKANTLFMRAKFRDYYDLYVLNKEGYFTVAMLYEMTAKKMNNLSIALFQRALTFTDDIEDESIKKLKPRYNVTLKQIENHFIKEIDNWNKNL
jgi:predicted nucleotidyltransferase component of viral defense system